MNVVVFVVNVVVCVYCLLEGNTDHECGWSSCSWMSIKQHPGNMTDKEQVRRRMDLLCFLCSMAQLALSPILWTRS